MSFLSVQFFGPSIQKQSSLYVVLPPGKGPFGVLYLLHGLSDDHTIWHRRTSIERYVEGRNLIVVMPDGGRSFYCNDPRPAGLAYEDHIVKDVVGFIDDSFPTLASRGGRAIAGLSMGGYGAMMLALRHPDMFCAACSHSGALGFCHRRYQMGGAGPDPSEWLPKNHYDCHLLAARLRRSRKGPPMPAIRMDCGTEDFLLDDSRALHAHLAKLKIDHVYEEFPGSHTWEYWDQHIQRSIEFVLGELKTKKQQSADFADDRR